MGRFLKTKHTSQPKSRARPMIATFVVCCIAMIAFVSCWLLYSRVKLDERGYDLTLALYRVCNQRSIEGLERIESELVAPANTSADAEQSWFVVASVVEKAKRGQWADAERDCRQLLEDQVTR